MVDDMQDLSKRTAPNTRDIPSIKRVEKRKTSLLPQVLFPDDYDSNSGERPYHSYPMYEKGQNKKDSRNLVLTPQGKHVLTSNTRLHLGKN